MEAREESEKTAEQLMSGGNKARAPGRRWSSSADLEIETATPADGAAATLGRSYSVAGDGGGVKQQAPGEVPERRRGAKLGAGARLSRKLKEHRARFYIVRRCVSMLVCWRDNDDAADD